MSLAPGLIVLTNSSSNEVAQTKLSDDVLDFLKTNMPGKWHWDGGSRLLFQDESDMMAFKLVFGDLF